MIPYNPRLNGPDGGFWVKSAGAKILATCNSCWRLPSASSRLNQMIKDWSHSLLNPKKALWRLDWVSVTWDIHPDNWLSAWDWDLTTSLFWCGFTTSFFFSFPVSGASSFSFCISWSEPSARSSLFYKCYSAYDLSNGSDVTSSKFVL